MGKSSSIEWTDHTFNPWWGCEKVSAACTHCYAETFAHRLGKQVWGKNAPRRFFGNKHWTGPHLWDIQAKHAGVRRRVFCASMADVFEAREDLAPWRSILWELIQSTTGLDWLLLTKRPENIRAMVPPAWLKDPLANVWYGTTVENQEMAELRIPALLDVPAHLRFLSCEPLLGPVDLLKWIDDPCDCSVPAMEGAGQHAPDCSTFTKPWSGIGWVIAGGESGAAPRYTEPAWIEDLIAQGHQAGAAVFVKQLGTAFARKFKLTSGKASESWEWPGHLRFREFPKRAASAAGRAS